MGAARALTPKVILLVVWDSERTMFTITCHSGFACDGGIAIVIYYLNHDAKGVNQTICVIGVWRGLARVRVCIGLLRARGITLAPNIYILRVCQEVRMYGVQNVTHSGSE